MSDFSLPEIFSEPAVDEEAGLWGDELFAEGLSEAKDAAGHQHKGKGPGGGQFVSQGGGSSSGKVGGKDVPAHHPGAAHGSAVRVKPAKERAAPRNAKGKIDPVPVKTHLTKQETGRVAEAVMRAYLKDVLGITDTVALNAGKANESIDLFGDHMAPEVKGGLCSNQSKSQQWRITFNAKLEGKAREQYESLTPEQQKAWREKKQRDCLKRKLALLKKLSAERGEDIKPVTFTGVVNPDKKICDIYRIDGYHQRIDWNDPRAEFVGSVRYDHAD